MISLLVFPADPWGPSIAIRVSTSSKAFRHSSGPAVSPDLQVENPDAFEVALKKKHGEKSGSNFCISFLLKENPYQTKTQNIEKIDHFEGSNEKKQKQNGGDRTW